MMRDHNAEYQDSDEHKYAYNFDSIVRNYMMQAFEPYFKNGKALEIGCFEGDSTALFAGHFDDLTVIEASSELIAIARQRVPPGVKFVHSTVETAELEPVYDAIFLVHTLEHFDDPVASLARLSSWLAPGGRLFVVVPNANAPSRQIAVKMGLIDHNAAVTPAEAEHGHRITYSFDTLERDVVGAGLRVIHRSGIFFKALANFQWDRLLQTDIVSTQYLDGCYMLGQQYPDLCASIFLLCEQDARQR